MANRLAQLRKIKDRFQPANEQVAAGMDAARGIRMQQALGQAGPGAGHKEASAIGTAVAGDATEAAGKLAETQVSQNAEIAKLGAQESMHQGRMGLADRELLMKRRIHKLKMGMARNARKEIAKLDNKLNAIQVDEAGQVVLNEEQKALMALAHARSEEEFATWAQEQEKINKLELMGLQKAHNILTEQMKSSHMREQMTKDESLKKAILAAKKELESKIAAAKAKSNNSRMIAGTIAGGASAIAVSFVNPALAPAAYSVGQGLGEAGHSSTSGKPRTNYDVGVDYNEETA